MSRPKNAGPPDEPVFVVAVLTWVWKPAHWVPGYTGEGHKAGEGHKVRGRWVQREDVVAAYSVDDYMKMVGVC